MLPNPRSLRRAFALAGVLCAATSLGSAPVARATPFALPPDVVWSQFQGDPAHTGTLPSDAAPPEPPYARAWTFSEPDSDQGVSAPVVAGNVAIAVGSKAVYGVDLSSGEQLWKVPRNGGPITSPALAKSGDSLILLFTEGNDPDTSKLIAVDPATQRSLWDVPLGQVTETGVTVDGRTAFVGDNVGSVHAFDVETGKESWTAEGIGRVEAPVAVANGLVYVASRELSKGNARIRALDESTGEERWSFSQQGLTSGSAVTVADGLALAGFTDRLARAFDGESGTGSWATLLSSALSPRSSPASASGSVYVADLSGTVERLTAVSGDPVWDFRFNPSRSIPIPYLVLAGSPVVAGSSVLIGLGDGRLAAISVASGRLVWESDTGSGSLGPIALTPEVVVVAKQGVNGGLVGYRNDPSGHLLDVPSPTEIDVAKLLGNFAAAFVIVFALVFLPARLLAARRSGAPAGDSPSPIEEDT